MKDSIISSMYLKDKTFSYRLLKNSYRSKRLLLSLIDDGISLITVLLSIIGIGISILAFSRGDLDWVPNIVIFLLWIFTIASISKLGYDSFKENESFSFKEYKEIFTKKDIIEIMEARHSAKDSDDFDKYLTEVVGIEEKIEKLISKD